MVFAHMCTCSTAYTLLSWLPTYFRESFPDAQVCDSNPQLLLTLPGLERHLPTSLTPGLSVFLQAGVYNVVPWLTAIPSALSGGCVSDLLITRGLRRATPLLSLPITKLQTLNHSFTLVGYGVLTVRKIMQVRLENCAVIPHVCSIFLHCFTGVSFSCKISKIVKI